MARKGGRPAIELEGGPQLRRALGRFDDRLGDMSTLHRDLGEMVAGAAHSLVPRLSGLLGETIRAAKSKRSAAVTAGGRRAIYGPPIHFGWRARNIEPQPFLYDALDERRGEVLDRYSDAVDGMVRRFDVEAPD
jgi:hypothetical protein